MAFLHVLHNSEIIVFFHLREHTVDQTIWFLNERRDTVRYLTFIIHDLSLLMCITYLLH